ncbi:MAG: radical SAM protein [Phycisphaeraceae bacterium]|nr:radical SAM protein [Phycisphaeraceae bacterium]MBX3368188.1 radical SAM protein [Phycisphaeraceae bacterium]
MTIRDPKLDSMPLFASVSERPPPDEVDRRPRRLGLTVIDYKDVAGILTKPKGFMAGYDYTINPYSGCAFGCAYCYAASFAPVERSSQAWGQWVVVKQNALELLKRSKRDLSDKSIYISSVTDPYQPIEKQLEMTREILRELVHHQPRLVIQTRSPLVARDIDLLKQFRTAQVNMTVTTDSEEVRKAFEPGCPANHQRLNAIAEVAAAGVQACVTMTPLLPVVDAEAFASALFATGVRRFIVQPFHAKKGQFAAGTRDDAAPLIEQYGWSGDGYAAVRDVLRRRLPQLGEGKDGFAPV